MRRSCMPSFLAKKRDASPTSFKEDDTKRKAARTALKQLNLFNLNSQGNEEDDSVSQDGSKKDDELAGLSHEERIQVILKKPFTVPIPGYVSNGFVALGMRKSGVRFSKYDPEADGALVLYSPPEISPSEMLTIDKTKIEVHVVVDPVLQAVLRPHQREGVKFMYDSVTGAQIDNYYGCIMADDMGLGKTLQCITLLWTLLQQSPDVKPTIRKAIIVAPSSLVKNWGNEIKKWLSTRITPMVIEGGSEVGKNVKSFMSASGRRIPYPVLIISYDTFRINAKILCSDEIGLLVCDEGHKLKNSDNLTYNALNQVQCKRRLLISGTPIQNDLLEYFSLVNFVNAGLLGDSEKEFNKKFGNPIIRGRDGDATDREKERGSECQNELKKIVSRCMIRRTADTLSKYLPAKHDYVICIAMVPEQRQLYAKLLASKAVKELIRDDSKKNAEGQKSLQAIHYLKKLCNHPMLVDGWQQGGEAKARQSKINPEISGKMQFLDTLLARIKSQTGDKVVLISNYTQTLDLFVDLCSLRGYQFARLDGSLTAKKRDKLVSAFNSPDSNDFIFMLSSKAGGCGLNLIGANRLVMFDPDWNPANDAQAMARCWRDGQKKECYVYRLLTQGSIEEKVFQRQTHKKALSSTLVDEQEEEVARHFSKSDLRDLFRLEDGTPSNTHDKLKCKRCASGMQIALPPPDANCNSDLKDWHHLHDKSKVQDLLLKASWGTNISFAFYQRSHEQKKTV